MRKKQWGRALTALFFAVLTAIGLFTCADYGLPVDETWEQQTLQENMHEYAVQLLGEDGNAAQWYQSRGIGRISQSTEKDHGQSAYYLFMPILERAADDLHVRSIWWHAYTWLWFMVGVWALYAFACEIGLSRLLSMLSALLLYLCPRFFAEGHYNNKDMVLLSLVLGTLWLGVRFLKKPCFLRGALLSICGALAANTKIAGAFAWGIMGLCAIVLVTADRRWTVRMACVAVGTVAVFAAAYAALTPALWTGPVEYLRYLLENASGFTRWTGVVLFRDVVFDQQVQPLPRYYLVWMMLVTLPLYVVPLAAAGQLGLLWRMWKQKAQALHDPVSLSLAAASLCWFVPLAAAVVVQPVLYNGWRHFYFVFAGIAVLGAFGIQTCVRFCRRHGGDCGMHLVFVAGLVLFFGWTASDMMKTHPYQYAYYNRLGHESAMEGMELDYWGVSTVNAMEALVESERDENWPLVLTAREDMSWQFMRDGYNALSPDVRQQLTVCGPADSPYVFSNATYARIYGTRPPEGYHEHVVLTCYGIPLCTIYEKDAL